MFDEGKEESTALKQVACRGHERENDVFVIIVSFE